METPHQGTALFHLPGLFEFYDLYAAFLPLYRAHRVLLCKKNEKTLILK